MSFGSTRLSSRLILSSANLVLLPTCIPLAEDFIISPLFSASVSISFLGNLPFMWIIMVEWLRIYLSMPEMQEMNPGVFPGSGRSLGEGNGNPLQYSGLGNQWTERSRGPQCLGSKRAGRVHAQRCTPSVLVPSFSHLQWTLISFCSKHRWQN